MLILHPCCHSSVFCALILGCRKLQFDGSFASAKPNFFGFGALKSRLATLPCVRPLARAPLARLSLRRSTTTARFMPLRYCARQRCRIEAAIRSDQRLLLACSRTCLPKNKWRTCEQSGIFWWRRPATGSSGCTTHSRSAFVKRRVVQLVGLLAVDHVVAGLACKP